MACGCKEKLPVDLAAADPTERVVFTAEQIELLGDRAKVSPRVAKSLQQYERHVTRIRTLLRVLDPEDTAAVGNPNHGNEATYRAEIARREMELVKVEQFLCGVLQQLEA